MNRNKVLEIISFLLYGTSLILIAVKIGSYRVPGYEILLTGWMAINISWLANLPLFYAWKNIFDYRKVRVASSIAIILALSLLLYDKLPYGSSGIFKYELKAGYYFWISSMILCLFIKYEPKEEVEEDVESEVMSMFEDEPQ